MSQQLGHGRMRYMFHDLKELYVVRLYLERTSAPLLGWGIAQVVSFSRRAKPSAGPEPHEPQGLLRPTWPILQWHVLVSFLGQSRSELTALRPLCFRGCSWSALVA